MDQMKGGGLKNIVNISRNQRINTRLHIARLWKLEGLEILWLNILMEEVICRINPANSALFAGLIRQIVPYLPD